MKQTITAVIPVREGSRRLKNKNILPFGDSNLLIHKIRQLKEVEAIDNIVVSSDSDLMLEMAEKEGVLTHRRIPKFTADDDTCTFNEVVENVVQNLEGDHIMWTTCVCPLFGASHFEEAVHIYKETVLASDYYDSLVSAKLTKDYIWNEDTPLNYTMEKHTLSQDLPNWYTITNALYMASRDIMLERKYFLGKTPYLFEVDKIAAVDIDDESDLEMARALYNYQKSKLK